MVFVPPRLWFILSALVPSRFQLGVFLRLSIDHPSGEFMIFNAALSHEVHFIYTYCSPIRYINLVKL